MFVTPVIEGKSYYVESEDLNNVLNSFADVLDIVNDTSTLSAAYGTKEWGEAFRQGQILYNSLTVISNSTKYNDPDVYSDVYATFNDTVFKDIAWDWYFDIRNNTGTTSGDYSKRKGLVDNLYKLRSGNTAQLITNALAELSPEYAVDVAKQPSLQDYVLTEFAKAGESSLNINLNSLGDSMEEHTRVLEGLSYLNRVLGVKIGLDKNMQASETELKTSDNIANISTGLEKIRNSLGFLEKIVTPPAKKTTTPPSRTWTLNVTDPGLFHVNQEIIIPTTNLSYHESKFTISDITNDTITFTQSSILSEATFSSTSTGVTQWYSIYSYEDQELLADDLVDQLYSIINNESIWCFSSVVKDYFNIADNLGAMGWPSSYSKTPSAGTDAWTITFDNVIAGSFANVNVDDYVYIPVKSISTSTYSIQKFKVLENYGNPIVLDSYNSDYELVTSSSSQEDMTTDQWFNAVYSTAYTDYNGLKANFTGGNSAYTYDISKIAWFNDLKFHNNVQTTVSSIEFVNQTQKQKLSEVFFIYTRFLQSASMALSKLDQVIATPGKRINK